MYEMPEIDERFRGMFLDPLEFEDDGEGVWVRVYDHNGIARELDPQEAAYALGDVARLPPNAANELLRLVIKCVGEATYRQRVALDTLSPVWLARKLAAHSIFRDYDLPFLAGAVLRVFRAWSDSVSPSRSGRRSGRTRY